MGYELAPLADRIVSLIIDLVIVAVIGILILIVAIPFSLKLQDCRLNTDREELSSHTSTMKTDDS